MKSLTVVLGQSETDQTPGLTGHKRHMTGLAVLSRHRNHTGLLASALIEDQQYQVTVTKLTDQ